MKKTFAILFILTTIFTSCILSGTGSNAIVKEKPNEKHTKKAILFLKESGATVANSYQVSIIGFDKPFDTTMVGNTFTVDGNHGATFLDSTSINFTWFGNDTLRIDYDKKLRTFIKKTTADSVTIIYKAR